MTERLAEIQRAIDSFRMDEARDLVKEELKEEPSAAAYYLASQAALNHGQRVGYLQKALEIDPEYQVAIDELALVIPPEKVKHETGIQPVEPVQESTLQNVQLASLRRRWVAIVIDGIIVAIATVLLLVSSGAMASLDAAVLGNDELAMSEAFSQFQSNTLTSNIVVSAIYNVVLMVLFNGQTLGKMLLKLRVIKKRGGRITILDAILRNVVGYTISQIFLVGYLWAVFDREKQAWHDKMAGTVVVDERQAVSV